MQQIALIEPTPRPIPAELLASIAAADARIWSKFQPPPAMLVSEWAERNRFLPKGTTARPGLYVAEAFQRGIQDAINDPEVRRVVCKKSTQVGWTEMLLNICGYLVDVNPQPMMLVFVRDTDAKDKSKKTIQPMIAECPALRAKVRENKSRNGGNTQQLKQFDGGFLKIAGANSAANMRSDPCSIVLFDEVDGYPDDVDGEGSPIEIGERRTDTFEDAKILIGSTPAKPKGISTIDAEYEGSDQRMFYVPCPQCGEFQPLLWRDPETKEYNLVWDKGPDGIPLPQTVRYRCKFCRGLIEERFKQRMLDGGRWVAKYPERMKVRGFYLNALYSPWKPVWVSMAEEFVKATDVPEKMKAFVNLRLGETWDEGAETFDPNLLTKRCEPYLAEVPDGVGVIVASVDVQFNRLECQITGYGRGQEQWLIKHEIFWGAPGLMPGQKENEDLANVWDELDEFLLREWRHESGVMMRPAITLIDSGAYADAVAKFVLPRQNRQRRVYACKGQDYLTVPGLVQDSHAKKHRMRLFNIATYTAKDRIMLRLRIPKPGPGYQHFPTGTTDEYFSQLTAESKIRVVDKRTRRARYQWVVTGTRNETLDLTVYAHGALEALQTIVDPQTYGDLSVLVDAMSAGATTIVQQAPRRRVLSQGIS